MRALFSFDEALSPGVLTTIFQIVSAFIALFAIVGAIALLTALNTAGFFTLCSPPWAFSAPASPRSCCCGWWAKSG